MTGENSTPRIETPIDGRERDGPLVRPAGCHPQVPIVRRIGDRPLFLGNRFAADPERYDRTFDAVLTVAEASEPGTTHHRPLVDGPEAEWSRFRAAVDAARRSSIAVAWPTDRRVPSSSTARSASPGRTL